LLNRIVDDKRTTYEGGFSMKKRLLALSVILAFALSTLAGCTSQPPADSSTAPESTESNSAAAPEASGEPLEIAVVVKIVGIPFFNVFEDGVKKAAEELGVNAYVTGPTDADPAQQVKIVEDLINAGVDAIVVVPNDATALEAVLQRARDKGIFVVANESPGQSGADYDVEMIDNKLFAEACAQSMADAMGGKGDYVFFVGGLSVPLHNTWADVAKEYLTANYPEMNEVTDRIPCGEDAELAHTKTLELIKTYPELSGILGFGSLGPIGAAQAVREKDLIGKVHILGNIIPSQGAQYLADGSLTEGFLWDPADSGYASVFTAKYLLEGGDINDPAFEIPGIGKPAITDNVLAFDATLSITKENAESLGF